jgi:hypothetical protein
LPEGALLNDFTSDFFLLKNHQVQRQVHI